MRIVLHIGFEKTGTTTIQDAMWWNAKALRRQGVLYPTGFGTRSQIHLALAIVPPEWMPDIRYWQRMVQDPADHPAFAARMREMLRQKIAATHPEVMVISTEFLSSRLDGVEAVRRAQTFFGDLSDDIRIVAYIRRQDDTYVSHYSTTVKAGCDERLEDYTRRAFWLDYDQVLRDWADVFGQDSLEIRTFPPQGDDLLAEFTEACEIPAIAPPKSGPLNPALDHRNAALLAGLNRRLPNHRDKAPNPDRAGLVEFLEARSDGPKLEIGRERRGGLLDDYAAGNAAVRARFFPDRDTLFPTHIPDRPVPPATGYDDALDLAVDMWRDRAALTELLRELERKSVKGRIRQFKDIARQFLRRLRLR